VTIIPGARGRGLSGGSWHHLCMRSKLTFLLLVGLLLAALLISPAAAQDEGRVVEVIELQGIIDPTTADYLRERLDAAQDEGVHAAIIKLDTPGGLDISMRDMIKEILNSDVSIVVWIAPRGARAASAGTFITYAANLAYMAEATELGAATPVSLGDSSEVLDRKITEDAVAFIRDLAATRGRNADWAEDAVRNAASLGASEAVEMGVVDGIASSLGELLQAMDGQPVKVANGSTVTLETWDESTGRPSATVRFQDMNLLQQVLHAVTNPEIAFFLILIGAFGIIFELYNPGIGLAGILGGISLLLGFYSLSILPTNWLGVLLIVASVIFFVIDLQVAGLGVFTAGGVASLIAGGLLLFAGASSELQVAPVAIGAAVVLSLLFFISVMAAALRVRLRRPITGEEAIVGMVGEAKTDIAPEGTVMTKGTLWRARTMETGIAAGSRVKVMATEGLVLLVEPLHEREASSVE
jgi:membrane-bound serine protease (ClpP class)